MFQICGLSGDVTIEIQTGLGEHDGSTIKGTIKIILDEKTTDTAVATVLPHNHEYETIGSTLKDDISDVGSLMQKCQENEVIDCKKTLPNDCSEEEFKKILETKFKHALEEWAQDHLKRLMPSIF